MVREGPRRAEGTRPHAHPREEIVPAHQRGALRQDGGGRGPEGPLAQGEDPRCPQADGRRALPRVRHPGRVRLPGAARVPRGRQRASPGGGHRAGRRGQEGRRRGEAPAGGEGRRAGPARAIPPGQPAVAMATLLVHIALLAYAAAAAAYLTWLVRPREGLVAAGRALLFAGLLLHLGSFAAAVSLSQGEGLARAGFGSDAWRGGQLFSLLAAATGAGCLG